jgi:hypothetical protein
LRLVGHKRAIHDEPCEAPVDAATW